MTAEYRSRRRSTYPKDSIELDIGTLSTYNINLNPLINNTNHEKLLLHSKQKGCFCSENCTPGCHCSNNANQYDSNFPIYVIKNVQYYMCCFQLISSGSSTSNSSESAFGKLWTGIKNKFGSEIFSTKKALFLFLLDWFLDFGTAIVHFSNGNWIEGTMTYLIVLFAGTVTTIGYLKDREIRNFMQDDTRAAGLWLFFLLHIPSWFLFVCLKMKLYYLEKKEKSNNNKQQTTDTVQDLNDEVTDEKFTLEEKLKKYADWVLSANWLDTVMEAKPQALLQTIFLLETQATFTNGFRDYVPLALSIWSIHSITGNIYAIILDKAVKDKTPTYSRFYGYTYTILSNLAPAMCINTTRDYNEPGLGKFLVTIGTLVAYYVFLAVIERLIFSVSKCTDIAYGKVFHGVMSIVFLFCGTQWVIFNGNVSWGLSISSLSLREIIVLTIYSLSLVGNIVCFWKAMDFADVSFQLKNEMIQKQSQEFKDRIQACKS